MFTLKKVVKGFCAAALVGGSYTARGEEIGPPPGAGPVLATINTLRGNEHGLVTIHKANDIKGAGGVESISPTYGHIVTYESRERKLYTNGTGQVASFVVLAGPGGQVVAVSAGDQAVPVATVHPYARLGGKVYHRQPRPSFHLVQR